MVRSKTIGLTNNKIENNDYKLVVTVYMCQFVVFRVDSLQGYEFESSLRQTFCLFSFLFQLKPFEYVKSVTWSSSLEYISILYLFKYFHDRFFKVELWTNEVVWHNFYIWFRAAWIRPFIFFQLYCPIAILVYFCYFSIWWIIFEVRKGCLNLRKKLIPIKWQKTMIF